MVSNFDSEEEVFAELEKLRLENSKLIEKLQKYRRRMSEDDLSQQALDIAGVILVAIERNQCVFAINQKGCEICGYSHEEIYGKNWFDTCIPDRDREATRAGFHRFLNGEYLEYYENLIITSSGEERLIAWHNKLLFDKNGTVRGTLSSGEDITERKQTEDKLKRLAHGIETIRDYVLITDRAGKIEYINPAFEKIVGIDRARMIGSDPSIFPGDAQDIPVFHRMWMTIQQGKSWQGRLTTRQHSGISIIHDCTVSPIRDEHGDITGYVAVGRDVTEHIRLETQLAQAQKMEALGTLAGGIAHDFNNILTGMMGYSELALDEISPDHEVHEYLEHIFKGGKRARELVKQILFFSRQTKLEKKPLKLENIVLEALKLLRASFPSTIEIVTDINDKNDTIVADTTQIHQVVMNLCSNSKQAMEGKGGRLAISLSRVEVSAEQGFDTIELVPGRYQRLSVSDTGCGMSPETIKRVFDPFYTTKSAGEGTGMGLSVVHGIVKDHNGAILVESELDKGSTFHVFLPIECDKEIDLKNQNSTITANGSEHILLVDDEEDLAELGFRMLTKLGYKVTPKTSSLEALESLSGDPHKFDAVITDMTMPHMTGTALAREILKVNPSLPVILYTGFNEHFNEQEIHKLGIRTILSKPLSIKDVAIALREVLD